MLNIAETAVGKIEVIPHKAGNTEIVEQRTIAGGKTAAAMGIIEAIRAEITAMAATAEFHRGKQGDYNFRERVFTGQVIVIIVMMVV